MLISITHDLHKKIEELPTLSKKSIQLRQKLSGLSYREKGKIVMQGQVLEKSITSCQYLSNHNGARGFMGLGYFSAPKLLPYIVDGVHLII